MAKRKVIKLVLILLTGIAFVISIYYMTNTYAVFYSKVLGTSSSNLARWNIVINGANISSGVTEEFVMNEFNMEQNANVKNGKMAPGVTGNFEILINPADTDVSIRYDISIDTAYLKDKKLTLVCAQETQANGEIIKTGENTYTGIMPLSDIKNNCINNIKITFYWENNEINNGHDTSLGTKLNSKLQIPITVNAIQYLGETITEYID